MQGNWATGQLGSLIGFRGPSPTRSCGLCWSGSVSGSVDAADPRAVLADVGDQVAADVDVDRLVHFLHVLGGGAAGLL